MSDGLTVREVVVEIAGRRILDEVDLTADPGRMFSGQWPAA